METNNDIARNMMKRAVAYLVIVSMTLTSFTPAAMAATRTPAPPRIDLASLLRTGLGDTQAIGAHHAQRWEKLSDLARQAQGQGSLTKSGPRAFLAEPVDVARLAAEVLKESQGLDAIAIEMEQQFARDEQYLREKGLPQALFERLEKARFDFRQKREQMDDAVARLTHAQRIANYDAQKDALGVIAKLVAAMPSSKSFIPMSADAIRREGEKRRAREPFTTAVELRTALEGPQPKNAVAKAAPLPPTAADLAETDDVQLTPKIRELAASLGNNPVAIFNWVHDNIDFVPTYGSIQGSEVARINKKGNATDTASLTIALLRAAGIHSRYVYGFVEMPVAKVQNWLGGGIAPNQVVELMTKAGIPAQAVVAGGQVSAIRFEHTWVEAYVDFTPSRGAVNRAPSTWVPLDASFKTYDIHAPINLTAGAPLDVAALLGPVDAAAIKGPNGSVTGFNLGAVDSALDAWRPSAVAYANQVKPNARLLDVRGYATIVPSAFPVLPGSLPYTVLVQGNTYSALPQSLKHIVTISYYATETDYSQASPSKTYSIPLAKVGLSTIGVDYVPATQADRDLFAQLRRDNAASLAPYLINVIPQIQVEGQAVVEAPAVAMGTVQYWKADISDPQGIFPPAAAGNRTIAGSHTAFVFDAAGMSADLVQKRLDLIPDGVSYPIREGLQQAGLHFWALRHNQDQIWASQFQGKVVRLPSVGGFSAPLQVTFSFGVARSGQFRGYQTDIKRNVYAAVNPTQAQQVQMFTMIGTTGSLLEGAVWEMLFGVQFGGAANTTTILAAANEQRIPVFMVDASNLSAVLPQLQITADAKQEISNAVAAGKRVVVPQTEVTMAGGWRGTGYVIQDPQDGTGVYQIDGGLSGSMSPFCILKALLESCIFQKLLARQIQRFMNTLISAAVKNALLAAAGVVVPLVPAMAAQYMWFLSFQFAMIDFVEMMATGNIEQEIADTVAAILACSKSSPCAPGGSGPPTSGNPVITATGEKFQLDNDYVGGGDSPLVFARTYLSEARNTGGRMGKKWRHSYERSIYVPPPTTVPDASGISMGGYSITIDTGTRAQAQVAVVPPAPDAVLALRGDGSYYQYNLRSGSYRPFSGDIPEAITRSADASGKTTAWTYFNANDETEVYDADGRLQSITDRAGRSTQLSYDPLGQLVQVRNAFGRTLVLAYNANGDVDTVTDPANGVWRYGYDSLGNLTSVTGPDQKTRRYHYEQNPGRGLLTGITDENNQRWATYRYDYKARVVEETHAGGADRLVLDYQSDRIVKTTDGLGTVRTHEFQKVFETPRPTKVTEPCTSGCVNGGMAEYTYDANGFVGSQTDFNGNRTAYSRDVRGLERSRTEASGTPIARTISTEYDPQWRVPVRITEPTSSGSRVTTFTLDSRGNVKTKTVTVGTESRTWTYDYNAAGQKILEDGPRTDVADTTRWTYLDGNLETMTDAAGNVTRYGGYDAHGRPGTMTDPNGLVTAMTYDARGRLKTSSAGGETTVYDYDGAGNLQKLTLPDGTFLAYGYDAAQRLTSITDSLGNSVAYTLDEAGNRKAETTRDPSGALAQTMSRVFDALSRVKELRGASNQLTAYTYDRNGNLKSASDPLAHGTANDYDALNRLTKVTEPQVAGAPAAGTIGLGYDARDNLTSVTDQRGLVTSYAYSGFDELKTLSSPDTGVEQYTYDPAGNVKSMVDARGQSANYGYDAVNRLKSLLYTDETLDFTYDDVAVSPNSKGRLSKVTDASGSTTYGYDPQGRVTVKTQVAGAVTSQVRYRYNAAGQMDLLTTPSGQAIGYAYTNNQVTSITVNGAPLLNAAKYFPFGDVAKWTWGNGETYQRVYDLDARIASVTLGTQTRAYGFDDASRITGLTDRQGATTLASATFGYDNLDRLSSAVHSAGAYNESFAYDLVGNRTSHTVTLASATTGGAQVTAYTYSPTSNRLTKLGGQDIGYDPAGNTQSDGDFTYRYSGRNRLVEVKQGASTVATYKHNAFGERVAKTLGGSTTTFVYDEDGRLLGEYGAAGALIQETVWLDDTPVATLRPKSGGGVDVYYVWADHLDTPRAVTTSANPSNLIWRWDSDPFGMTAAQETGLTYNLRFPGQYFDVETTTHYNYYRDYNPQTGRYQQSDPIGIWGGLNTYAYVENDPLRSFDPLGWSALKPRKKIPGDDLRPPKKRGNAPISCRDGYPIELHHYKQKGNCVDEMTRTDHRLGDNFAKNHSNTGQSRSKIPKCFAKDRRDYWTDEWDKGRFKKKGR